MGAHHSLGRGDADGFEVGTTYADKAQIAREIAERQIAVAEALPKDHPARDAVLRHALREQRRAARFTRRAKHCGTRTRRATKSARTARPRTRARGHRPARRPGASSRTSSNDPGAGQSDEPPPVRHAGRYTFGVLSPEERGEMGS